MARVLFLLLVGFLTWGAAKKLLRFGGSLGASRPKVHPDQDNERSDERQEEFASSDSILMVECAACGLHVPHDEALMRQGQPYCSQAHALAGSSQPSQSP